MHIKQFFASLSMVERVALAIGIALLVVGVVWAVQPTTPTSTPVKQQIIPMTLEDFNDDPTLQGAIQKQLNRQQTGSPAQPQASDMPLQSTAPHLQP